jgi:hypothetical protein
VVENGRAPLTCRVRSLRIRVKCKYCKSRRYWRLQHTASEGPRLDLCVSAQSQVDDLPSVLPGVWTGDGREANFPGSARRVRGRVQMDSRARAGSQGADCLEGWRKS